MTQSLTRIILEDASTYLCNRTYPSEKPLSEVEHRHSQWARVLAAYVSNRLPVALPSQTAVAATPIKRLFRDLMKAPD